MSSDQNLSSQATPRAIQTITLFLCGDVMTGRVLPYPDYMTADLAFSADKWTLSLIILAIPTGLRSADPRRKQSRFACPRNTK
jgi:hypothetical protein